jgi:hypothetical protein
MKKPARLISAAAAVVLVGWAVAPAFARPPTVGVNPGYDRRLIESRKHLAGVDAALVPVPATPARHGRHHRYRH